MSLSEFEPRYLSVDEENGIVCVRFNDEQLTDEDNIEEIGRELFTIIDQFGKRKLIMDLSGLKLVTSSVLGKMITLHRKLHRLDGKLVVCGAEDYVVEILRTSRLNDYFNMAENAEQAATSFD